MRTIVLLLVILALSGCMTQGEANTMGKSVLSGAIRTAVNTAVRQTILKKVGAGIKCTQRDAKTIKCKPD